MYPGSSYGGGERRGSGPNPHGGNYPQGPGGGGYGQGNYGGGQGPQGPQDRNYGGPQGPQDRNYGGPQDRNYGGGPQGSQGPPDRNYSGGPTQGPQGSQDRNYSGSQGPQGPQDRNYGGSQGPQGGGNYGAPQTQTYSAESNQRLSDANTKLTFQLASKDTVIDEKTREIETLNNHSKQLVEQISSSKASGAERIASLERAIHLLKAEIEEAKVIRARELESQRSFLQKEVDQAAKIAEEMESRVQNLSAQLTKMKHDQENEGTRLSSFIAKTMVAIDLTNSTAQQSGYKANLLLESESNLGFSKMTMKSLILADGTVQRV